MTVIIIVLLFSFLCSHHSLTHNRNTQSRVSHFCSPGVGKKLISYRGNIIMICILHCCIIWGPLYKNLNNVCSSSSLCIFLSFFMMFFFKRFFSLNFYLTDLNVVILEEGMVRTSHCSQRPGVDLGSNKSQYYAQILCHSGPNLSLTRRNFWGGWIVVLKYFSKVPKV